MPVGEDDDTSNNMLGNPMPRKLQENSEEVEEVLFYTGVVIQYCITNWRSVSHITVMNYPWLLKKHRLL